MPYPNQHAARVEDPDSFVDGSMRTISITRGITAIVGKLSGSDKMHIQAYRFNKNIFTAEQAKAWLKEHKVNYIMFEAAKEDV